MQQKEQSCEFMLKTISPVSYPVPKSIYNNLKKRIRNRVKKVMPRVIGKVYSKIKLKLFPLKDEYLNTMNERFKRLGKKPNLVVAESIFNNQNLQPGEWVEVRSWEEICSTFDGTARLKGLGFMLGMEDYCGGKFKVYKRVQKLRLETTGEMRKMKSPVILLEGVFCSGKHYEGCDRSCFYFWREAWLKRISDVKQLILYITSYVFVETGIDNCCSMLIS